MDFFRMRSVGFWLGGVLLCVGFFLYGWGFEESPRSELESRPPSQGKTASQAKVKANSFEQTRAGGNTGTGGVVKSLLPASSQEESWLDGRAPGSPSVTGLAAPTKSMGIESDGRNLEEIEGAAELRQKIAEELAEKRRFEKEQALAQELALGDYDQDYDAPDSVPDPSAELAAGLGDLSVELDPELIELDVEAQGRDVEEVEALADLRQELAEDFAQEQQLENLEQEHALANELALGDYDQDSGEDPRTRVQETSPQAGLEPVGSGAGAVVQGGDGDG